MYLRVLTFPLEDYSEFGNFVISLIFWTVKHYVVIILIMVIGYYHAMYCCDVHVDIQITSQYMDGPHLLTIVW